ncbi:MAG: response regulator [Gemmatimonadota bacterium]|nr:response regulator [Gemmatimonadota bacterium]
MNPARDDERTVVQLQKRLTRMSRVFQQINEELDATAVLQSVLDCARSLTGAMYGTMSLLKEGEGLPKGLVSGWSSTEARELWNEPDNEVLFNHFGFIEEPLRMQDMNRYLSCLGLPEFRPPMPLSARPAFLACPLRHHGERLGTFLFSEKEGGAQFTAADEETLVMFASFASMTIANVRRYRDEQRARADLEALIKTSPVSVTVFNGRTGDVVSSNRESERIERVLKIQNRPLEDILKTIKVCRADGRELSSAQLSMAKVLASPESVRAEEITIEGPEGDRITALLNITPILSDDGVESLVLTLQDMTFLQEFERQRTDFLGIVSHELRAPLAAIKGSAATVLGDGLALGRSEMLQFFRIINQHADQMSGLVNDLLDVARIGTGTLQVSPEPTPVTVLVDRARNTFLSGGGKNEVLIELAPDLPPVNADPRRISQVLVNLLLNADRHSPKNTPLRITAWQQGMHVAFCVVDKGRGISAERLPHVFRDVLQHDVEDRNGEEKGSGWGLSICKGIVEVHGGRIWVESDGEGHGTRVTFTVPNAENEGDTAHAMPESCDGDERSMAHTRTPILVVDDDPQTLRKVREALSKVGFMPVTTADPEEVPGLVEQHRPHLVLLDLVLPETDGIEMMQTVFKHEDIPVVFLSAYAHEEAIDRALAAGAADYLVKPFSPTELVSRIRVALRKARVTVQTVPKTPFVLGDLTIDYARRRVAVGKRDVILTAVEYRLLVELSMNFGATLTHERLLQTVWHKQGGKDTRPLRSAIKSLRRKLNDEAGNPTYIFNHPRVGYRLGHA